MREDGGHFWNWEAAEEAIHATKNFFADFSGGLLPEPDFITRADFTGECGRLCGSNFLEDYEPNVIEFLIFQYMCLNFHIPNCGK